MEVLEAKAKAKAQAAFLVALLAALLSTAALCAAPLTAFADDGSAEMRIAVGSTGAQPGDTVTVPVTVENNPGVLGATIQVTYDSGLTLQNAANGSAWSALSMTKPGSFASPCRFTWDGVEIGAGDVRDGEILLLTFAVDSGVESGSKLAVSVSAAGSVVDASLNAISVSCTPGAISVSDFTPGDVDGDGSIDSRDVVYMRRHITGGYPQSIKVPAADVDANGKVEITDVILLRRYLVGYNVELKRSPLESGSSSDCAHEMESVAYHAPTCTEDGNIAYWHCAACGKYFSNAMGLTVIELSDTILAATGHTPVIDPGKAPTYTDTGLTEGSHCSTCGTVLKAQEVIPVLEADEYTITYDVANGDSYLAGLAIANDNRTTFKESDSFRLSNLSADGYRFLGWYDGAGDDATKVTRVEKGTNEDLELYAHWQVITYTVQFESDLFTGTDSATYTVDKGLVLPTPKLSNYVFIGWVDQDNKLYSDKKIPAGTTGNITLAGNWTSERNKTYTNPHPSDPVVVNDEENNVMLFAYEIGRVENVPLYTIKDFGYISGEGITKSETSTYSTTTSETTAETIANTIANATTKSSSWTLSEDWNESTSISEEWCKENGYTKEQAETVAKSNSSNWNVSSGSSGSFDKTTTSVDNTGWSQEDKTSGSSSTKKNWSVSSELNASLGVKGIGSVGAQVNTGYGLNTEDSHGFENGETKSGSHGDTNSTTESSSWNSSSSYGGSSTTSRSSTVSTALSEKISNKYGYGKNYSHGGSTSQGLSSSSQESSSNSYTSSVTYDTSTRNEVTSSWTTSSAKAGYHRWIVAGTAHVFGVVGYDIKTKSYFVYTYTVMDDETHEFEDYSYTSALYNDNENGVVSFEVPYDDITDAVSDHVYSTNGLKVDLDTGTIVGYTGQDTCVVIPEYFNADGDVVKVTGLAENAFKGNTNVVTVVLSDFITSVPDRAFEGCTSLRYAKGANVTSIGDRAFAGCTSLEECGISADITHVGEKAFDGAETLYVDAANAEVAQSVADAGAKNLVLNLGALEDNADVLKGVTLTVPSTINRFELRGNARTFNDFRIVSDATETVLQKVNISSSSALPVQLSSGRVAFDQSNIASPGISVALTADSTQLGLRGSSSAGKMLSKNLNLYETAKDVVGKLIVSDKLSVCGSITGFELLECNNVETIDEPTFEKLLKTFEVALDVDGGTCDVASISVNYGSAVGELPVPTKEYHTFAGWYLKDADEPITADTVLPYSESLTLYAHWTLNEASGWVKASEVPADAQVVDTKWTYNLSIYKQVPVSYVYFRYCSSYDGVWNQDSCWINNSSYYEERTVYSPLASAAWAFNDKGGRSGEICGPYDHCGHKREGQSYWWLKQTNYQTQLDRVESKESASKPSGNNISDVTEWARYRAK